MFSKIFSVLILAFTFILSSCGSSSSSGSGSALVVATSSDTDSMLKSVDGFSKIGELSDYVESKSSSGTLTPEQELLLNNCTQNAVNSESTSQSSTQVTISGVGCPISYSLNALTNKSGNQFNSSMNISYKVLNSEFAQTTDLQSANCSVNISGTQSTNLNMTGSINCQFVSKLQGAMNISLNLSMQTGEISSSFSITAAITGAGKMLNINMTTNTLNGVTTNKVLINGQVSDKNINFAGLTNVASP